MEQIQGKRSVVLHGTPFSHQLSAYREVLLDIGTGDGRFVLHAARCNPTAFAIGIDASRENLRRVARTAPPNALFLIANALALPPELHGIATRVTIHFPWGSLLSGLLDGHAGLLDGIRQVVQPGATLDVCLNAGALLECGWPFAAGGQQVARMLHHAGFSVRAPQPMEVQALRRFPSTWAKRLAFGRDARAVCIHAVARRLQEVISTEQ